MLRETRTRYGKTRIGYIWAILEPLVQISVFWMMFYMTGRSVAGMSVPIFFLTGFMPWGLFVNLVQRNINAVEGNRALLKYPQVKPLDLVLARTILEAATNIVALLILLGAFVLAGYPLEMHDIGLVMQSFGALILLGLGLGLCLSCVARYLASTDKVVGFLLRPLFWMSGLFFVANYLPFRMQKLLMLNPMLHVVEYMRAGFFASYKPQLATLTYPAALGVVLVFFGLLLERYTRKKIVLS